MSNPYELIHDEEEKTVKDQPLPSKVAKTLFTWPDMVVRPLDSDEFWERKDWFELLVKRVFSIPRFGGGTPRYTVGHHQERLANFCAELCIGHTHLFALLHDMPEAITGDIIAPMKTAGVVNTEALDALEAYLLTKIYKKFGLEYKDTTEVREYVYKKDKRLAEIERDEAQKGELFWSCEPVDYIEAVYQTVAAIKSDAILRERLTKPVDTAEVLREAWRNAHSVMNDEIPEEAKEGIRRIFEIGAKKYARGNWLEPGGKRSSEKDMHDSMFHHLAQSFAMPGSKDAESGEDHLLHLITRAIMLYTRRVRGIFHPDDQPRS